MAQLAIAALAVVLVSCSCGGKSPGTIAMSISELRAKLKALKTRYEAQCPDCEGRGHTLDGPDVEAPCPACKGTGKIHTERGASAEEFHRTIGEPFKREEKDLVWEWWYYECTDGTVRIEALENHERGDVPRILSRNVERVK